MIKKIMFIICFPLVGAEKSLFVGNPLFNGEDSGAKPPVVQAWVAEEDDAKREEVPEVMVPSDVVRNFRALFQWSPADIRHEKSRREKAEGYLSQFGIQVFADKKAAAAFRKSEEDAGKWIIFDRLCAPSDFIRSIAYKISGMIHVNTDALPVLTDPVTFILGARTLLTPRMEAVSFSPLSARGKNDGFLSVFNALTALAYFKGDSMKALRTQEFLKGIMERGQGVLCHNVILEKPSMVSDIVVRAQSGDKKAQAEFEAYKHDKKTEYPTSMNPEHIRDFLGAMGAERVHDINLVSCETSFDKKHSTLNTAGYEALLEAIRSDLLRKFQVPGQPVVASAYIVADTVKNKDAATTNFFALAYAYYAATGQVVGTILDPNLPHSDYRIKGAQSILSQLAHSLQKL